MNISRSSYTEKNNFFGSFTPGELADKFETPLYVYNENILRTRIKELAGLSDYAGFAVNYSVKANSNPALLKIIREEGALADAMSPGELAMDLLAGYNSSDILYISNNNSSAEMLNAIAHGCLISVDSLSQLEMLGKLKPGIKVMTRLNPGIGAGHHDKVVTGGANSKFGIGLDKIDDIMAIIDKYKMTLAGLNQHIGSLFMKPEPYLDAVAVLLETAEKLPAKIFQNLEILDFGGGFGIPYRKYEKEMRLDMPSLGNALHSLITQWALKTGYNGKFLVEPGRYAVAECGLLLGQVTAVKNNGSKTFAGTDLGFNTLMRPMLYDSFHDLEVYSGHSKTKEILQTIVGNICESGDILAKDRMLPVLEPGDLIGVLDAGAYGFSMASNYNERLLPAEVLIESDGNARLIRRRQTIADLERCLIL